MANDPSVSAPPTPPRVEVDSPVPPPPPPPPPAPLPLRPGNRPQETVEDEPEAAEPVGRAKAAVKLALDHVNRNVLSRIENMQLDLDNTLLTTRRPSASRTLVVPSLDASVQDLRETDEDLKIMTRLLSKAVGKRGGAEEGENMLSFRPAGSDRGRAVRSIYLHGYGALFVLQANFPLAPAPAPTLAKNDKTVPSPWEEARGELFGRAAEGSGDPAFGRAERVVQEYDESRVKALKQELLEGLQQAVNMRHLAPGDYLTVTVLANSAPATEDVIRLHSRNNDAALSRAPRSEARSGESVLMIRVKKSDVEALAKGTLDAKGFEQKAEIRVY